MKAGERYYVITDLRTNQDIQDWLGQTERFETEEDAEDYIKELVDDEQGNLEDYRIDCLRW